MKAEYVFRQVRTIPIPITTIGMRLPHNRTDGERVAASKPQALGMVANARLRLNTYKAGIAGYLVPFLKSNYHILSFPHMLSQV